MFRYSRRTKKVVSQCRFIFGYTRVRPDDTPSSSGMVHALEQRPDVDSSEDKIAVPLLRCMVDS